MTGPREIPAHDLLELRPKSQRYALVIPVVNEGERIRRQLRNIAALGPRVDVVIADGGSDDGSVAEEFLRQVGVRALLIKRGPGRLSAQLRMAYAWCLDQGYEGIVTVDGNDKDDLDAVDRFVGKLEDGYDLVQGSRYLPGGAAINTPLDRKLAGRLLHAPLVSWAAGFRYTDTTNGFRGYSARFLLRSAGLAVSRRVRGLQPSLLSLGTCAPTGLSLHGDSCAALLSSIRQDADQDPLVARALAHAARAGSRRGRGFQPSRWPIEPPRPPRNINHRATSGQLRSWSETIVAVNGH